MKRKTLTVVLSFLLVLVFALTLTACSTGKANNISLDKTDLTLAVGEEYTLTATTDPADAAKDLTWKSDDPSVATVTGGTVKGVKTGYTTVWAESSNGIKACCNITVKEIWQTYIENTAKQTAYTVTTVEDLGMGFDNGGDYYEMFGIDTTHTAKVAVSSNLYSVSSVTTMTQEGEPLEGSINNLRYGVLEGNTAYTYYAKNYGTNAVSWLEGTLFANSETPEASFAGQAAGAAFDSFNRSFLGGDGNYYSLMYLPDYASYDKSTDKLTVTGLTIQWSFMDPEGGQITKEFDAEIEVTFENGLVKTCVLNLSRNYGYYEIFGSNPSNDEPETLILQGVITAEAVYGNTQVSIPAEDQATINKIKGNRPLANAFNALNSDVLNFTMTEQKTTTGQNVTTAKYAVGETGGVYAIEGKEYLDITVTKDRTSAVNYFKDGSTWYKKTVEGSGLSDTVVHKSLDHTFFVGDKNDPDWSQSSVRYMYGDFTKGDNNTYTATFSKYLGEEVNPFVDCVVTVKLDAEGRLSSIEYNYGAAEDGEDFVNLKYTFTNYGTTHASIPQSVIDQAKEIGSSEDSVISKAFGKLNDNTQSFTKVYSRVNSANPDYNVTETETFDDSSMIKKTVSSDSGTNYYKLVPENGDSNYYRYYTNSGIWVYVKYNYGSEYDYALSYLARIDLSTGSFATSRGGEHISLADLYWAFELSGTAYSANLFEISWNYDNQDYDYIPCTVSISLDDEERITSLTITKSGEVEEYAISYASATVALPAEVENAIEQVSQSESVVGQAFTKLNENSESVVMQHRRENASDNYDNLTETDTVDLSTLNRKIERTDGNGTSTSYSKLVSENGQNYIYAYAYNSDIAVWNYYKSQTTDDSEYAVIDFARLNISTYGYALTDGGDVSDIMNLYWAFTEKGGDYVANMYKADSVYDDDLHDWVDVYTLCTVTVKVDADGRLTSLKIERAGFVEEYTFTYGSASVTLPAEVESAKEYVSQSDSEIYNAFEGLGNNQSSVTVEYVCTDHNAAENNVTTRTHKINVDSRKSEKSENGTATSYVRIEEENGEYVWYEYNNYGDGWHCSRAEYGNDYDFALQSLASLNFHNEFNFTATQDSQYSYNNPGNFYPLFNQTGDEYNANLYRYNEEWNDDAGGSVKSYTPCTVTVQLDGSGRLTSLTIELNNGADIHVTHQYTVTYGDVTVTVPDDVLAVQP